MDKVQLSSHKGTQYMVTAKPDLPKHGGNKGSNRESRDAPSEARATCLEFCMSAYRIMQQ
jgi:hypothetical protein